MALEITHKQEVKKETFERRFSFEGNKNNVTVKSSKGDGEINSSKDRTTIGILNASLNFLPDEKKVRLSLKYMVEENGGDNTVLYFDAEEYYSVESFYNEGLLINKSEDDGRVITNCTPKLIMTGSYKDARVVESFKGGHDYQKSEPWNRAKAKYYWVPKGFEALPDDIAIKTFPYLSDKMNDYSSVAQDWLPVGEIKMKIDGPGDDFKAQGNIGVSGKVVFTLVREDNITVTRKVDDELPPEPTQKAALPEPTRGGEQKVEKFHSSVDGVLGRGYKIWENYAETNSCSKSMVLDYKKLNEYGRIIYMPINDGYGRIFSGEGMRELTSSIERELKITASVGVKGVTFTNEMKQQFHVESTEKSAYKYLTQMSGNMKCQYMISYYSPKQLIPFLHETFLESLNELPPDKFIEHYGTHVVLGMGIGTRFAFFMKYRESLKKKSTAITFENNSSISYNNDGKMKEPEKKEEERKLTPESVLADMESGKISTEQANAFANVLKAFKELGAAGASGSAGGGGGDVSISATASFKETLKHALTQEDKSTEIECYCRGGMSVLAQSINGGTASAKDYDEWVRSGDDIEKCVFCDFSDGALLPIYEIIPEGYRLNSENVKKAYYDHLNMQDKLKQENIKHGTLRISFHTEGSSNTELISGDEDMYTKQGKEVWWNMHVYLLNFENGRCGFSVSLIASEGGSNQSQTVLKNTYTRELDLEEGCQEMAIDTERTNGKPEYHAEATWYGEFHGWQDATNDVLNGNAGKVLCCNGEDVQIMLDGSGKDKGHVGVKGTITIPWIGY